MLLERDGDGGLAGGREAREPDRQAGLFAERGTLGVREGGVPGDVAAGGLAGSLGGVRRSCIRCHPGMWVGGERRGEKRARFTWLCEAVVDAHDFYSMCVDRI